MKYYAYAISHGGKIRGNNEDNLYLNGIYRKDNSLFFWEDESFSENGIKAAVFDGVGGEDQGEVASFLAAKTLDEQDKTFFRDGLERYLKSTNEMIKKVSDGKPMGSTFIMLNIIRDVCWFSNVGDSRGYVFRNHTLKKMTKDHNMVTQLMEEGILTKEQARNHPDRHAIYQYLGMDDEDELSLEPYEHPAFAAKEGDYYLLCSDGLTDMVSEERIEEILDENHEKDTSFHEVKMLTKLLVQEALEHGGRDNVTVILIKVEKA